MACVYMFDGGENEYEKGKEKVRLGGILRNSVNVTLIKLDISLFNMFVLL